MYVRTRDVLGRAPGSYIYDSASPLGFAEDQGTTGAMFGEANPSVKHRDVIFFGYSGWDKDKPSVNLSGTQEKDSTHFVTALTLKEHIIRQFPADDIKIICAWHKNGFVNALMTPSAADPSIKIRQIHYVGHGNQGGLFFGYNNKAAVAERTRLNNDFIAGTFDLETSEKRSIALDRDASLLSGFFTDGLDSSKLARIKAQLAPEALMHIWGCFAGAPQHTFDTRDPYWSLFNAAGASVDGIAKHIAKSLEIQVTTVWDPSGIHGTDFCIRDITTKAITCPDKRKSFIPTWSWPLSKKVRWITYDSAGNGDEKKINFLGTRRLSKDLAPGKPPKWFTDEIPKVTTKIPALPACSAAYVVAI